MINSFPRIVLLFAKQVSKPEWSSLDAIWSCSNQCIEHSNQYDERILEHPSIGPRIKFIIIMLFQSVEIILIFYFRMAFWKLLIVYSWRSRRLHLLTCNGLFFFITFAKFDILWKERGLDIVLKIREGTLIVLFLCCRDSSIQLFMIPEGILWFYLMRFQFSLNFFFCFLVITSHISKSLINDPLFLQ